LDPASRPAVEPENFDRPDLKGIPRKVVEYLVKKQLVKPFDPERPEDEPAFYYDQFSVREVDEMPCTVLKFLARTAIEREGHNVNPVFINIGMDMLEEFPCAVTKYLIQKNLEGKPFKFENFDEDTLYELPCQALRLIVREFVLKPIEQARREGKPFPFGNHDEEAMHEFMHRVMEFLVKKSLGSDFPYDKMDKDNWEELAHFVFQIMGRKGWEGKPEFDVERFDADDIGEFKDRAYEIVSRKAMHAFMHKVITFLAKKTLDADFPYDRFEDRDWEEVAHKVFEIMGRKGWNGKPEFDVERFNEDDLGEFKRTVFEILSRKDMPDGAPQAL